MTKLFVWFWYIIGVVGGWFAPTVAERMTAVLIIVLCVCTLAIIEAIKEHRYER